MSTLIFKVLKFYFDPLDLASQWFKFNLEVFDFKKLLNCLSIKNITIKLGSIQIKIIHLTS